MEILILGFVSAFNFCILIWKLKHNRVLDFCVDCGCMIAICSLFTGSTLMFMVGMVASMTLSLYLLFFPVKLKPLLRTLNPLK